MSIGGALQIGRSALAVSQAGIQIAGQNMANAATPGYTRQVAHLAPAPGDEVRPGMSVGTGVRLLAVTRQIDTAIQARLRDAVSSEHDALIEQRFLTALETIQNELTDNDLSSLLSDFFNAFSELANNPLDESLRSVVVQQTVNLTDRIVQMRSDYGRLRDEVDRDLGASLDRVNSLLDDLAAVNLQISQAEQGAGTANALRDRRDAIVDEIAQYMEVTAIEQDTGGVDLLVGSLPVVLGGESRGVELRVESDGDDTVVSVRISEDQSPLDIDTGRLGALLRQREDAIRPAMTTLDTFARELIRHVNGVHSGGQGLTGFTDVTGTTNVRDTAVPLNDAEADLPFAIEAGAFRLHVTQAASGTRTSFEIAVDGNAMSLDDLATAINATAGAAGVTAQVTSEGALQLIAANGIELSFSDDNSGTLTALGINTLFTGRMAGDIGVNERVVDDVSLLAAGSGHVDGSNGTALSIALLQDQSINELSGMTLTGFWQQTANGVSTRAASANDAVDASKLVRESIAAQMQAVSGVSLDEEAISLMTFQRQFQAAARFIGVIDETLQTLLAMA